jgi:hypothetical protein
MAWDLDCGWARVGFCGANEEVWFRDAVLAEFVAELEDASVLNDK